MRLNICSCLLVFVLGCKVTAAIKHEVVQEKQSVTLPCPHSVESEVTWSTETNGHRVDILTTDGDRDKKHIPDPGRRYSSLADKSLYIRSVTVSDSGTYLCNNAAAVELTVIPSGTIMRNATEKTNVTLNCPHGGSDASTWSKDGTEMKPKRRFSISPVDKTLSIRDVKLSDSGLYYCDGKPAVYLTVIKGKKKTTPPPTTTKPTTKPMPTTTMKPTTTTTMKPTTTMKLTPTPTTKPTTTTKPTMTKLTNTTSPWSSTIAPTDHQLTLTLVIGIVVPLLLIILLLIFYLIHRRRFKRRGTEERFHVYDEIKGGAEFQVTNSVERVPVPTDAFYMVECPGGSNPNDPTYYTIPDLQPMKKATETSGPDESLYSEICETFIGGNNNKGSSQPTDNTYCLLQNPKTSGKHPK
ncbi:hemicentin-1-like [Sparus aurata]|uniref:hemicentin-1-like n=1 Tax=Sparus aurata TaxID=8175 RepID=UPI0011C14EC9|nr:hemicentin-1-like [Sparus aurata]